MFRKGIQIYKAKIFLKREIFLTIYLWIFFMMLKVENAENLWFTDKSTIYLLLLFYKNWEISDTILIVNKKKRPWYFFFSFFSDTIFWKLVLSAYHSIVLCIGMPSNPFYAETPSFLRLFYHSYFAPAAAFSSLLCLLINDPYLVLCVSILYYLCMW